MSDPRGSEWARVKMGDVLAHRKERARPTDPLLSVTNDRGVVPQRQSGRRDISSANKLAYWRVYPGDIVYNTMRMWQGVSARSDYFGIVSPAYTVCLPQANADSHFLSYVLKLPELIAIFKNRSQGLVSDTWNLKYRSFAEIDIALPSYAEQQNIAKILDTGDKAIRSTEQLIGKLKQAKRGLLHDLLTCGIESRQLHDSQGRRNFKDSGLGAIPRSWTVKRLADIGHVCSGATPSRSITSRYFTADGLPWVKTLDLNEGSIFDTDERVSGAAIRECSCPLLRPRTVLLAMYGGWGQIGRTGLLMVAGTINQAISAIELTDSSVLPEYLLIALQHGRSRWRAIAASTRKDPNITRQDVLAFEVPIPPVAEQEQIVEVDRESNARLSSEKQNLSKLKLMKQGLMEDLLTGRVRMRAPG